MTEENRVWLRPPFGVGEPIEVDATADVLTPLLVLGYSQCEPPPVKAQETTTHVSD